MKLHASPTMPRPSPQRTGHRRVRHSHALKMPADRRRAEKACWPTRCQRHPAADRATDTNKAVIAIWLASERSDSEDHKNDKTASPSRTRIPTVPRVCRPDNAYGREAGTVGMAYRSPKPARSATASGADHDKIDQEDFRRGTVILARDVADPDKNRGDNEPRIEPSPRPKPRSHKTRNAEAKNRSSPQSRSRARRRDPRDRSRARR